MDSSSLHNPLIDSIKRLQEHIAAAEAAIQLLWLWARRLTGKQDPARQQVDSGYGTDAIHEDSRNCNRASGLV